MSESTSVVILVTTNNMVMIPHTSDLAWFMFTVLFRESRSPIVRTSD